MTFHIFVIFHDFSMTFHDHKFFHDFPWLSMTVGTLYVCPKIISLEQGFIMQFPTAFNCLSSRYHTQECLKYSTNISMAFFFFSLILSFFHVCTIMNVYDSFIYQKCDNSILFQCFYIINIWRQEVSLYEILWNRTV